MGMVGRMRMIINALEPSEMLLRVSSQKVEFTQNNEVAAARCVHSHTSRLGGAALASKVAYSIIRTDFLYRWLVQSI
jgi:hypothetical protein